LFFAGPDSLSLLAQRLEVQNPDRKENTQQALFVYRWICNSHIVSHQLGDHEVSLHEGS
jgi:hypothetical protein